MLELTGRPVFVGEWSLALKGGARSEQELAALPPDEQVAALRAFFRRQAGAITRGRRLGGFFWTWNSRARAWGFSGLEGHGLLEREWWSHSADAAG